MSPKRQSHSAVTKIAVAIGTLAAIVVWTSASVGAQRDRGINQPGAAGNRPARATPAGYGGSARQVRVSDPGINQPGAAGNTGRDPGRNQPGATGNRR